MEAGTVNLESLSFRIPEVMLLNIEHLHEERGQLVSAGSQAGRGHTISFLDPSSSSAFERASAHPLHRSSVQAGGSGTAQPFGIVNGVGDGCENWQ